MKNSKLLLLIASILLGSCFFQKEKEETKIYNIPTLETNHEYSEIKEFELTWEGIFDPTENEYFVYFYSTSCNHCAEIKNFIIEEALKKKNMYFVKGSNEVVLTDDVYPTIGAKSIDKISILGFPSCLKIIDHTCTKNVAGTSQIKEIIK